MLMYIQNKCNFLTSVLVLVQLLRIVGYMYKTVVCVKKECHKLSIKKDKKMATSGMRAVPKRAVRVGYTQSYMSAPKALQTTISRG